MSSDSVILEVNHHSYVLLTTDKMSLIDNAQIMRDLNSIPYKVGENLAGPISPQLKKSSIMFQISHYDSHNHGCFNSKINTYVFNSVLNSACHYPLCWR